MFRIKPEQPIAEKRPPQKDKDYLSWLHTLPCIISGTSPVQAAHVNTAAAELGHDGRGGAQKAHDSFALPLNWEAHHRQGHMNEMAFWAQHEVNPHICGLVLFGIYSRYANKDEATNRAIAWIRSGGPVLASKSE